MAVAGMANKMQVAMGAATPDERLADSVQETGNSI